MTEKVCSNFMVSPINNSVIFNGKHKMSSRGYLSIYRISVRFGESPNRIVEIWYVMMIVYDIKFFVRLVCIQDGQL